jgi:hypothetical protein
MYGFATIECSSGTNHFSFPVWPSFVPFVSAYDPLTLFPPWKPLVVHFILLKTFSHSQCTPPRHSSNPTPPYMPFLFSLFRLCCDHPFLSYWSSLSVSFLSSQTSQGKFYWSLGNAWVPLKVKVNKSKASCWTTKPSSPLVGGNQLFRAVRLWGTLNLVMLSRRM